MSQIFGSLSSQFAMAGLAPALHIRGASLAAYQRSSPGPAAQEDAPMPVAGPGPAPSVPLPGLLLQSLLVAGPVAPLVITPS